MLYRQIYLVLILAFFYGCKNQKNITNLNLTPQEYYIECNPLEFQELFKNYTTNNYISISIKRGNEIRNAKMRIRGDSSRDYDKKSLKIKITDSLSIQTKKVFNFNAEYTDLSFLRSFLSSSIFKHLNYPCFSANFAKIYINNKYYGLFLEIENIDKEFLKNNGLNPDGDLFKASKDGASLYDTKELESKWEKKTNKSSRGIALERLIDDVSALSNDQIYTYVKRNFNYPMLIDYLAINAFIANGSTYYHNYYLYKDQELDGKWIFLPWDLDKTLSYYNWKPYKYHETSSDWEYDNPFIEKCFLNENIFNDFKDRIEFFGKLINKDFYNPIFNSAKKTLSKLIIDDKSNNINLEKDWLGAIKRDRTFLTNRSNKLIKKINELPQPFSVQKTANEVALPFKIVWEKKSDSLTLDYELWLSNHFLFPDSLTYKFKTDKNFYFIQDDLPLGSYYWKVLAHKNSFTTEGFNSKNKLTLKTGKELPKRIDKNMDLDLNGSPYRIVHNTTIDSTVTVNVMPGVTILFEENKELLCKGELNMLGDHEQPIKILPASSDSYFNSLFFYKNSKGYLKNVHIKDGLINAKRSILKLDNVNITIKNRPMNLEEKRASIIWAWYGEIQLNNISLVGNKKGEGINISWAKNATITNSTFYNTPDAIELINVNKGLISNNLVSSSPDDGIDLNSCSNIIIKNNTLLNNADKGISIGVDWGNEFITEHGRSHSIKIKNNYILGNKTGIAIKDSSEAYFYNNIISFNQQGVSSVKKHKDYEIGGTIYSTSDQIQNNATNIVVDEFSRFFIKDSGDSLYIKRNESAFWIPSLITYTFKQNQLILNNKAKWIFELDGWALLDNEKNTVCNFNKNDYIKPEDDLIIESTKFFNKQSFMDTSKWYLKDNAGPLIRLIKNE